MLLDRHPGMSWHDLQATPARVVQAMLILDAERARASRAGS